MDATTVIVVLLFLLGFAVMVLGAVFVTRKEKANKTQVAQLLGMTPGPQPDVALAEKIFALYRTSWGTAIYTLRNGSRAAPLADGELFLFDLVDTSGDDNSLRYER